MGDSLVECFQTRLDRHTYGLPGLCTLVLDVIGSVELAAEFRQEVEGRARWPVRLFDRYVCANVFLLVCVTDGRLLVTDEQRKLMECTIC